MSEPQVRVPCAHSMDDQEVCFATQCPLCLVNDVERLKEALKVSMRALNDWLHTYAPEMCDGAKVKESRERIAQTGTLAYIALVQQGNRRALELAADPIFECCNDACPWRGPGSETVHPKHAPEDLLCPECREVVEQV